MLDANSLMSMQQRRSRYDAVVIGSGPNGLAAAIVLARNGCSVLVLEASERTGGGARSAELTLPGFVHDVCSAIHPFGAGSQFFRTLPLSDYGLEWIQPLSALAHPFDDGTASTLERSIENTGRTLGPDAASYQRLMAPLVDDWKYIEHDVLAPLHVPRHPFRLARFGLRAIQSATALARHTFTGEQARGLFAGMAAHAIRPLEQPLTAGFALSLGILGHLVGWPVARGGSQRITDALVSYFHSLGGELVTGVRISSIDQVPPAKAILCDLTPRQLITVAGRCLPAGYRRQLERYRYGPAVFKVDFALDGPIPWRAEGCSRAGAVHLGGTMSEIAESERATWQGQPAARPFVLLAQQSLFDTSRAPSGRHTVWAYCHVPHGSTVDMTDQLETQIERFAPGFRDRILARHTLSPAGLEAYNANYIGGDIAGGVLDLGQLYARPAARLNPYATPLEHLFICSSSTPPGAGVHGLCGYYAACTALRRVFKKRDIGKRTET